MEQKTSTPAPGAQQRIADAITSFCGDMRFVYIHVLAFGVWIATRGFGSDHFPFNFLTMAVSLEAIFLSTFILISQNRQQAVAEAHNAMVQQSLLQMLRDVIDDEKLDQANEEMIQQILDRIDVEHIRPMEQQLSELSASGARIERALGARGKAVRLVRWRAWTAAAAALLIAAIAMVASPRPRAPERAVQVVDVELPNRGAFLGRITPTLDNPDASLLDPLMAPENP